MDALNYCAHAIDDLIKQVELYRPAAPLTAEILERLIALLRRSEKFILPNCGELIDPDAMRQTHLDLLKLPYPVIALEARWVKPTSAEELAAQGLLSAPKRIALCWELREDYELAPGINQVLQMFPAGGVFVVPIFWLAQADTWTTAMGGSFIPYENKLTKFGEQQQLAPASKLAFERFEAQGQVTTKSSLFAAEPFYIQPEFAQAAIAQMGKEKAFSKIIHDSRDEVQMLVQTCAVINCANVTTDEIPPPAKLNKKRMERGNQPLFTYKVLQLTDAPAPEVRTLGGHHASPRMHLRRGHLRRLESKTVYVNPHIVSTDAKHGVVVKDYRVSHRPLVTPEGD